MITDEKVEKALEWLLNNAHSAAKARAEHEHLIDYRHHLRARLMVEARKDDPKMSAAIAEALAYAHPDYADHLEAIKLAAEQDALYRWRKDSAQAVIAVWQSFNATQRAHNIL